MLSACFILFFTDVSLFFFFFFFNDTATTEIYTLSLHDALPIYSQLSFEVMRNFGAIDDRPATARSEEHTSELQSRFDLVCRLLLEKKKTRRACCASWRSWWVWPVRDTSRSAWYGNADGFQYVLTFFFFNDTATTEIYTLSLHDALPISAGAPRRHRSPRRSRPARQAGSGRPRSEEHTSELQSRFDLVCRLLLEKKK